ncbi:MAG: PRC-barrel domain-containing protein [Candidatus Hydrogenedentota bacterium]
MLLKAKPLLGYGLKATDGVIGTVYDLVFDEATCVLRYLVADTGSLLPGRKVLLATVALGTPQWDRGLIPVGHTREQVRHSPVYDVTKPISRADEVALHKHYRWAPYWAAAVTADTYPPEEPPEESDVPPGGTLRSLADTFGYAVEGLDGAMGFLDDFVLDDQSWSFRLAVVDTATWLDGRMVAFNTHWIARFAGEKNSIETNLPLGKVKNAPPFDPEAPINEDVEAHYFDYYGRPADYE